MIQRVQSIYLALAIILLVLCCSMPLAVFEPQGPGFPSAMYSLVLLGGNGAVESYSPIVLFLLTVLAEVALIFAFISFKHRRRQMALCRAAAVLEVLWVVAFVVLCFRLRCDNTLHVRVAAFFPVAAIVLTILARRGVKKDEELVRSADRIR